MKIKAIVLAAIAALVLSGAVYAGGGSQSSGGLTLEKGTLTVGMEIGYPPMEYYADDGKTPIGFDVSMAKALAAKMGLKVKFVDTAWDGIFAGVDTSKYDCIMSSVTITDARKAAHNFTKPYVGNAMALVLLKNSAIKAKNPSELVGLGVAYQEETTADFYMTDLAAKGLRFTPYEYDKVMYCFDELKLGRVDAIVTDSLVAVDYVAPADSPFEIVWQGPADEVFGICLKKGNDALTAELDKALDALFADGTMLKISKEIFGGVDMVSAARN
ncbi:ABC transporter substrate-binding protein [Leadbettera azotonutricia]|uniref:Glutamine ABC transporter substrate-binding protein n=1 Tax=Leadbettera azotonutricia (strain ATCC BAA-888 / DSM 13862 / ZAS-9) TaxID=545695 RepID=F5YFX5_LEAAZ|nr:ABC transporter substrate-binding protein [Leadbettera azotonutricia]AEF80091.1 glutamine ABC transporter substrate-binding protein [Leadbettera azotonutricia ZAS-9]